MDKATSITGQLLKLIDGREVLAALFTTYTFDPNFFELEVIPHLLNQDFAYSTDDRVKLFIVRENLREANLPIDVFYDMPMFRRSGECSPQMEYFCNGVDLRNRAFHGKVNMILLQDIATDEQTLLLGAGSNNLSYAGWWNNIECQHWEEVKSGQVGHRLINFIQEDVAFLNRHRARKKDDKIAAIDVIDDFITNCKGTNGNKSVNYFGLSFLENPRSFIDFLHENLQPLANDDSWTLEIISPFFADNDRNTEHQNFLDMGVDEITLFLPFDSEERALCQSNYYEYIQKEERIKWAQWRNEVGRELGLTGDYFRPLHAKVYHFYNQKESWVFVGSVNFTYKAIHENIEAGFLVKIDKVRPLLEPIPEVTVVEDFNEPDEMVPGENTEDAIESSLPELHLCFDWVSKQLTGRTAPNKSYEIEILGPEGEPVVRDWVLGEQESLFLGDIEYLEKVLKNGSLVMVRGRVLDGEKPFPHHRVLLQQLGWSHKPLNIPDLTAAQILAIYAGMSAERRQLMLLNSKINALVLSARGGELTTYSDDQVIDQFFCEYAEIFNAFAKLSQLLEQAQDNKQYSQVDYYLTGAGVDSLPTLINLAVDKEADTKLNSVTCYLLLLSALEIYSAGDFVQRPNVSDGVTMLNAQIDAIKSSGQLKLEDNNRDNREQFFKWFEEEFFKVYTIVEDIE